MFNVKTWLVYAIRAEMVRAGELDREYTPRKREAGVKWRSGSPLSSLKNNFHEIFILTDWSI